MRTEKSSLKTLSNIVRILQKSDARENPLAHIVSMVRDQMGVDVCSLYLLRGHTLVLVATNGLDPSCVGRVRMDIHEGLTGLAVEKLQPIIVNEANLHPRFKYFPESGEEKFHSFAAIPLLDREKVVGVLTIQTTQAREFTVDEIEVLKLITFQLAGVIHNLVTLEILRSVERPDRKTLTMEGIAVAPGFGVGPAFFIHPGISPVIFSSEETASLSPKEEWKKMEGALHKASADLMELEKNIRKKFSRKEADIFYSHRMILTDKSFVKKLREGIEQGQSSAQVMGQVIGEYIRHFETVEDPHFRERAADLEDLRQRVLSHLLGISSKTKGKRWEGILIAETLVPSDTIHLDPKRISGIVTLKGGITSHASVLARSLGIPAVMGVSGILSQVRPGDLIIVDGNKGRMIVNPEPEQLKEYEKIQEHYAGQMVHLQKTAGKPALTLDGVHVPLEANVGFFSDLKKLKFFGAEGVGLYRTELPFLSRSKLPNEHEQFEHYRDIILEAQGLPITFRILDAGGDKPIESLNTTPEENPFLGYRSIRLSLSRPEILKTQFRSLLRASDFGPIRILVPMISGLEELRAVKQIFEEEKQHLLAQGDSIGAKIPFGIMIEVPSAIQLAHHLMEEVDFFSIGTNDLIQYTLAVDRNNERVATFFEPLHPAVLSSIAHVAKVGKKAGKPVGVCGEAAGDPLFALLLVGLGISQLSVIPSSIPLLKMVFRQAQHKTLCQVAAQALQAKTVQEVKAAIKSLEELTRE